MRRNHEILDRTYQKLTTFRPSDDALGLVLFGVAVEKNYHPDESPIERERLAYEVLLGKFDAMLRNLRKSGSMNRGLVIHDRRVVAERDIQSWTAAWRTTAERIGQLKFLADVPLFGDSRATRLLQAADLISYGVFRRYNRASPNDDYFETMWSGFHALGDLVHGAIQYTPDYGQGTCDCRPCVQRLLADSAKARVRSRRSTQIAERLDSRSREAVLDQESAVHGHDVRHSMLTNLALGSSYLT